MAHTRKRKKLKPNSTIHLVQLTWITDGLQRRKRPLEHHPCAPKSAEWRHWALTTPRKCTCGSAIWCQGWKENRSSALKPPSRRLDSHGAHESPVMPCSEALLPGATWKLNSIKVALQHHWLPSLVYNVSPVRGLYRQFKDFSGSLLSCQPVSSLPSPQWRAL